MQVYGAGGKTAPKRGRLGTGSYYPQGTPLFMHQGSAFAGQDKTVDRPVFDQRTFGDLSRAANSTISGGRNLLRGEHPNKSQFNYNTQPLAPAMVVGSSNDQTNLQPVHPGRAVLAMPHERNTNSASGTKKKPLAYRTVFGASKSMPVDSAFDRNPNAQYRHKLPDKPKPAHEAVKKSAGVRTFARPNNPPTDTSMPQQRRTPPPSFVSRGNMWFDPHNSFIAGHMTTASASGAGRWTVVKKGVV